jgi:hypothetical protein
MFYFCGLGHLSGVKSPDGVLRRASGKYRTMYVLFWNMQHGANQQRSNQRASSPARAGHEMGH